MRRPSAPPDLVLRYAEGDEGVLDVRLPVVASPAPVVVLLHGGFWKPEFDRIHTGSMAVALAAAGYLVVTPEYRRVRQPGGGWPGTLDDVAAALDALPALLAAAAPDRADLPARERSARSAGHRVAVRCT